MRISVCSDLRAISKIVILWFLIVLNVNTTLLLTLPEATCFTILDHCPFQCGFRTELTIHFCLYLSKTTIYLDNHAPGFFLFFLKSILKDLNFPCESIVKYMWMISYFLQRTRKLIRKVFSLHSLRLSRKGTYSFKKQIC